MAQAFDLSPR